MGLNEANTSTVGDIVHKLGKNREILFLDMFFHIWLLNIAYYIQNYKKINMKIHSVKMFEER